MTFRNIHLVVVVVVCGRGEEGGEGVVVVVQMVKLMRCVYPCLITDATSYGSGGGGADV